MQNAEEKKETFKQCMQDEKFKELTSEEKTRLYTRLISLV